MSRNFVEELLIFLLLVIGSSAKEKSSNVQTLSDGNIFHMSLIDVRSTPYLRQVSIAANSTVTFNITDVSSDTSFIIFQIHVYQYNVTLSYDKDYLSKVPNRSVFGSNIGLFSRPSTSGTTQLFVENDNTHVVKALIVAVYYSGQVPVPGGCNMEFNTEIAPYMHVQTRDTMVIVDMQLASEPFNDTVRPICEKHQVDVTMYQTFLTEQDFSEKGYFAAIESMLIVQDIQTNGFKVRNPLAATSMRRIFSAYAGIGSVYAAVATYGSYSSAYVPSFSYGCNPVTDPSSCYILNTTGYKFLSVMCLCLGLLMTYLDPKFFIFVPMFFTGTVFGYAVGASIGISLLIGLVALVLWGIFCYCTPVIGRLLNGLTLGLLLSCATYFHLPDSFIIMQQDWIFWSLFTILTISIAMAYMVLCSGSPVIITSIFTSFMVVLPIDYYTGSTLKYIIINAVRRATVKDFRLAAIQHPVQTWDICLIILWTCLAVVNLLRPLFLNYRRGSTMERTRLLERTEENTSNENLSFIQRVSAKLKRLEK